MTGTAEVMRKCSEKLIVMLLLDRTWTEWQCKGLLTPVKAMFYLERDGSERNM